MKITFVLPIHNESQNITILYEKLLEVIDHLQFWDYQMVFINDGSKDDSRLQLLTLYRKDKKLTLIDLSRNFWHEVAVKAWLDHAEGDYVVIMDTDLQDPPHVIIDMWNTLKQWYDIVYAKRKTRKDGFLKDITAKYFYKFINAIASIQIPKDTGNFRIFTKQVLEAVRQCNEQSRFIRWLFAWVWFRQGMVEFDRVKRIHWETSYPLSKMFKLTFDALVSFSDLPLKMATGLGFLFSFLGFISWLFFIVLKFVNPTMYAFGITTTIILIFVLSGVQLIVLGIMGEYIARIYNESRNRPLYIIKEIYAT